MKLKTAIFDVDGTLLDTSSGVMESVLYTTKILGLDTPSETDLRKFIGPPMQKSFSTYYGMGNEEAMVAANIFREYYKEKSLYKATPYEGIYDVLKSLKDYRIGMAAATYKREDYAIDVLKYFHFDSFFAVMHGSDKEGKLSKADIIQATMNEMFANRDSSVYIGDTEGDINASCLVGCHFIGVRWGFGFNADNAISSEKNVIGFVSECKDLLSFFKYIY